MIKQSTLLKIIIIIDVYVLNYETSRHVKEILKEFNEGVNILQMTSKYNNVSF